MFEFLSNPVNILMILGALALLVAVIGGNVEGKGVKIPALTLPQRLGAGGAALLLLGMGVGMHLLTAAPQHPAEAIAQTESTLQQHQASEQALRERVAQLEAERSRIVQTAGQQQNDRIDALEREIAVKRAQEAKAAEQVASTRAVLDQKEGALRESERVVREYYAALNRRDFDAAKALYQNPGPKLERSLSYIDRTGLFHVNEIRSEAIAPDASYVVVIADIDARGGKERWQGTVKVASEQGAWKIASIDLDKPVHLARQ